MVFWVVLDFRSGVNIRAPIRVLVVDDFVPWRNYLVAKLGENPALQVVGCASDGSEAVLKAAERHRSCRSDSRAFAGIQDPFRKPKPRFRCSVGGARRRWTGLRRQVRR